MKKLIFGAVAAAILAGSASAAVQPLYNDSHTVIDRIVIAANIHNSIDNFNNATGRNQVSIEEDKEINRYDNGNIRVPVYGKYLSYRDKGSFWVWDVGKQEAHTSKGHAVIELSEDGSKILNWRNLTRDKIKQGYPDE